MFKVIFILPSIVTSSAFCLISGTQEISFTLNLVMWRVVFEEMLLPLLRHSLAVPLLVAVNSTLTIYTCASSDSEKKSKELKIEHVLAGSQIQDY